MPKMPDLSKMVKDLNLDGVVSNIKSMINPEGIKPEEIGEDAILKRIAELSVLTKHLASTSDDMVKQCNVLNSGLEVLFKELKAIEESKTKSTSEIKKPNSDNSKDIQK